MFKKTLCLAAIFFGCMSTVFASTFYVAPTLSYVSSKNTNGSVVFQGLTPKIAVGYGDFIFNPFFFGLEAFVMPLKPITINNNLSPQGDGARPAWSVGFSILPAVDLDGVVKLYARAGFVDTNFDQSNSTNWGAQIGLGFETQIFECWYARGEYVRSGYKGIGAIGSINIDEFSVGVVYRIG